MADFAHLEIVALRNEGLYWRDKQLFIARMKRLGWDNTEISLIERTILRKGTTHESICLHENEANKIG